MSGEKQERCWILAANFYMVSFEQGFVEEDSRYYYVTIQQIVYFEIWHTNKNLLLKTN